MRSAIRSTRPRLGLAVLSAAALVACDHTERTGGTADFAAPPDPLAYQTTSSCGAQFTIIANTQDAVAGQYGPAASVDTVRVCETWTGTDYVWSFRRVGSSELITSVPDPVQGTDYSNGTLSAVSQGGAPSDAAEYVGPTLFDFMAASQAQRQASYDDPYYAVRSVGTCDNTTQFICEQPTMNRAPSVTISSSGTSPASMSASGAAGAPVVAQSSEPDDGKFKKHGVRRRGVRALIEDKEEIERSKEGHRRFRAVRADEVTVLAVEPGTGLLVGEEYTAPGRSVKAKHFWKKSEKGWVRDRTETEATEVLGGRTFTSRSTLELRDLVMP